MVNATKREESREKVTVRASSLKRCAVIPSTNTIGKNTAMVVRVDAVMAIATSFVPDRAAVTGSSPLVLCE